MNGATLQMIREGLGMTLADLAAELGVTQRTVERWEAGVVRVPTVQAEAIEQLEADTFELVAHLCDLYRAQAEPVMVLATSEDDVSIRRQRATAFLVRRSVPALTVVVATPDGPEES